MKIPKGKEIGCLIIPKGENRDKFIEKCFEKERFTILSNKRGIISNVICLSHIIPHLKFPSNTEILGSQVLIEYIEEYKTFCILGVISKVNSSFYLGEKDYNLSKTYEGNIKNSAGNTLGLSGNLVSSYLSLFCKNVWGKISSLNINCIGNEESYINIYSSGWIATKAEKGIKLRFKNKKEILINEDKIELSFNENQRLTLSEDKLNYTDGTNKFTIDDSGYNFGNINFKKFLNKILNFLGQNIILLTSCGPSSAGCLSSPSGPQLQKLQEELNNINS